MVGGAVCAQDYYGTLLERAGGVARGEDWRRGIGIGRTISDQ